MTGIYKIEISFPVEMHLAPAQWALFERAIDDVCRSYELANPGRVMWLFGSGAKLLAHPMALSDDEPMPVDTSVQAYEISEREGYPNELARRARPTAMLPKEGSIWRHHNGNLYRVLFLTNMDEPQRPGHPPEVAYENVATGKKHSRYLDDWHRSFAPHIEGTA